MRGFAKIKFQPHGIGGFLERLNHLESPAHELSKTSCLSRNPPMVEKLRAVKVEHQGCQVPLVAHEEQETSPQKSLFKGQKPQVFFFVKPACSTRDESRRVTAVSTERLVT